MSYSVPVAYQIAQILENEGVGTFATDLFVSKEPDEPDNCVTVYSTGGLPDFTLTRGNRSAEVLNFQVRVRNNDYLTAHTKMEAVRTAIEKRKFIQLVDSAGTMDFAIWLTGLPNDLQRDTKNRSIVTADFSCMRRTT